LAFIERAENVVFLGPFCVGKTMAMVLRYTHVHGRHIDDAIKALGRTVSQPPPNEMASAISRR
jgi:hypothetical protein